MSPRWQCLAVMLLFAPHIAVSKHVHLNHHHKHGKRLVATTVATQITAPAPTITSTAGTAEDAVISDFKDIQSGVSDLPGDLLSVIKIIENRLDQIEAVLESLIARAETTPVPCPFSSYPYLSTQDSPAITMTIKRAPLTPSALPKPPAPLPSENTVLTQNTRTTTTRTLRITSTRTRTTTISAASSGFGTGLFSNRTSNSSLAIAPTAYSSTVSSLAYTVSLGLGQPIETTLPVPGNTSPSTLMTFFRPTVTVIAVSDAQASSSSVGDNAVAGTTGPLTTVSQGTALPLSDTSVPGETASR